jgi:flagellar protein FlaG
MDIQNLASSSMPPGNAPDGTRVTVPVSNARASHIAVEQKPPVDGNLSSANLQHAVDNINKSLKQSDTNVQFSIDRDTKQNVVKMLDSSTGEVIRQFPSEVTLAISKAIDQQMKRGVLLNQKA